MMRTTAVIIALVLSTFFYTGAQAATVTAASCAHAHVQDAINAAAVGDTVAVPAGNCVWDWGSVALAKAITLEGAGIGSTNITLSEYYSLVVTKQAAGVTRVRNFSFSTTSGMGGPPGPIVIYGSWKSAEPIIFQNNAFTITNGNTFYSEVVGGLIIANNTFTGDPTAFILTIKDNTNNDSWTTADSMGTHDTNGKFNTYFEDNTVFGFSTYGMMDCDDNCRVVMRHNIFTYSGYNSHGWDTSPSGARHFEIYENNFYYPDCCGTYSNVNQYIWVRGGTGVIFNNSFQDINGQWYGDKPEVKLTIRSAEDTPIQGGCDDVSYPIPHQLGQSHDGNGYITDPIYFWGNTGTMVVYAGWNWGNPCGLTFSDFFQWGRDAVNGTAKPGYTPYTYPHPLVGAGPPEAPGGFELKRQLPEKGEGTRLLRP